MIDSKAFLHTVIDPSCLGLSQIMGRDMGGNQARVELLAISLQESGLAYRIQIGTAGQYGRGLWQFEKGGGVHGVCSHSASALAAKEVCERLIVEFTDDDVHEVIAWNDFLAACFARLLLYTDPKPLPQLGDEEGAWLCYERTWRPGKPDRARWTSAYAAALDTVMNGAG